MSTEPMRRAALAGWLLVAASARAEDATSLPASSLPGPVAIASEGPADLPLEAAPARSTIDLARGRALFAERCAACHGANGQGDGPIARRLDPRPRDFTRGVYKLRSTPTGSLPTDEDLLRTITLGVRGTSMLGWQGLRYDDRWQLVQYVKSLSPKFARRAVAVAVPVPPAPVSTSARVMRGEAVYVAMQCGKCHGPEGRGDGEAARGLEDDTHRRIYPFDMTRGWKLKSGPAREDIYRVLHTGLDSTPMPSYDGVLSESDTWALVYYVRSLFVDAF